MPGIKKHYTLSRFEYAPPNQNGSEKTDDLSLTPTPTEAEICYVDVPDEDAPVRASDPAAAFGIMAMYNTLRRGEDVRFSSLNLILRKKDVEAKTTTE